MEAGSQPRREHHRCSVDLLGKDLDFCEENVHPLLLRAGTLKNKVLRKEACPVAKTWYLSVMRLFGQLPMMYGSALWPGAARLHATTAVPGGGQASRLRIAGPCGELLPGHSDGDPEHTAARGCGVSPLPGKQGSLPRPCPEETGEGEAGARRLQPTSGAQEVQPTRHISGGPSRRARRRTGSDWGSEYQRSLTCEQEGGSQQHGP